MFDDRMARNELKRFIKSGPPKETQALINTLKAQGVEGLTVLDIGAGVGAIHIALLNAGSSKAIDIDASAAYLSVAKIEAARRGHADKVSYVHGNFVELVDQLEPADVVTLDRVICCYDDMPALVSRSAEKARRYYGVVFPVDAWWTRLVGRVANFAFRVSRNPFRLFVHPSSAVEELVASSGFERIFYHVMGYWQIVVYARRGNAGSPAAYS